MIPNWNKILKEWSYRVGVIKPNNSRHLYHLNKILEERGWPHEVINGVINNLTEAEDDKYVSIGYGRYKEKGKEKDSDADVFVKTDAGKYVKSSDQKSDDKPEKPKGKSLGKGDFDRGAKQSTPSKDFQRDMGSDEKEKTSDTVDTDVALDKLNNPRFGVDAKADTFLKKDYITKEDAEQVKNFKSDMEDFLQNPTKEKAQQIAEKYKLSQNASGTKLYLGILAGDNRKILGTGSALVKELGEVLNKFVPLKEKGDVQKRAMDLLQGASKPGLKTVIKSDDEGVKKLFSNPPYDRLDEKFHQIFGPTDKQGRSLRPSNKYAKEYFQQSVSENESLDKTINALEQLEQDGTASPKVREALEKHKQRMLEIGKKFNGLKADERRRLVEKSYSDLAREMHEADSDVARGLMKNMAEMALYDSELAGGDEVYLPSAGTFPSGDKLRIDRDGSGVVEKVAAVSVKFGKSGGFYGFPGESTQYQKFHPDEDKRTHMRNRVGHPGHAVGVRDDLIQDEQKFNTMIEESELGDAIKDSEKLRNTLIDAQKRIDEIRSQIEDENGKYKKKDLVKIRKELEQVNKDMIKTLEESVDVDELENLIGKPNTKMFMSGGCNAVNLISMAAVLKTSDGLDTIEHNHQIIDEDGLKSETDKGTPNLKDWKFQFRAFDGRGGGLLCGYVGGDQK